MGTDCRDAVVTRGPSYQPKSGPAHASLLYCKTGEKKKCFFSSNNVQRTKLNGLNVVYQEKRKQNKKKTVLIYIYVFYFMWEHIKVVH